MYLKGDVGEELFISVFVIALVFIFIFSVMGVYSKFLEGQKLLYAERIANSIAERIYFDYNGIMSEQECKGIQNKYGQNIKITYWKADSEFTCGGLSEEGKSRAVASMPIIITSNGKYCPGRIDVAVNI